MNFVVIVIAVMVGLWLYKQVQDVCYLVKSKIEHKRLLKWKKECEDNISSGKEIEKNKNFLATVEQSLKDFYKHNEKRWARREQYEN